MLQDESREFSYEALPGRVVFGPGIARRELAAEVDRLGGARVLLIATERGATLARELAEPLGGRVVAEFTNVRQHVPLPIAEEARKLAAEVGADTLLCVGGGAVTGTAKAVAFTSRLPILAVPTTYSGSEVTSSWGMTTGSRKAVRIDPQVLPRTVVYDPELTLDLPAEITSTSGFNALAHCVEAFWASGRNPISSLVAEEGIRALAAGLPAVHRAPRDPGGRAELLYGAYLAGSALAVAGSGLHHKICHALGGAYDLPHAQTHAIVLPRVMAFNAPAAPDSARRIARALGVDDPAKGLRELSAELGIPAGLRTLGMTEDQVDEAAALVEPSVPATNPRRADRAALREIIHAAWAGAAYTEPAATKG
ncbi:maleylacetate reductase [Pseudonocardia acaciae]|uniref:maleylacetate reductase n=1 Tax=Pseudonocardia acaciae TaxID=551276 RepID=UPI00056694AE|nr:maleylacetate reductase [Pseudonocardia acaciae]